MEGIEPTRPCGHRILSPARLPVPPHRLMSKGEVLSGSNGNASSRRLRGPLPLTSIRYLPCYSMPSPMGCSGSQPHLLPTARAPR
jgi:hypothetical protein